TAAPSSASWDDPPISPPPPIVSPSTAPPADLPPPAPRAPTRGKALMGVGIGLVALGGTSLLLVALPAAAVKRGSMNRAERNDPIDFSTRARQYRRARIADDTMEAGFWIGISGLVLGTALAITGGVMKSRSRARAGSMARIGPGPGGVSLRF
ncbi:MAG: hypothetical protein IAG13_16850, partial [Deltaproteobacteria bacterium]|nr:hypothetical protein [Nannocystaceae bacterium]